MIGPSKILTVSYGTFSCTLEGFDDPFNTMKAIAEYFRDLAAEDRYFGAEPPTPDAAMLLKIAEREVHRRVEAKINDNGVVLRTGDAMQTASFAPEPQPQAPVVVAQPAPQPSPQMAQMPDGVAAKLLRIRAAVANAELAEARPAAAPSPAQMTPILVDYSEDEHAEDYAPVTTIAATFSTDAVSTDDSVAPILTAPQIYAPSTAFDADDFDADFDEEFFDAPAEAEAIDQGKADFAGSATTAQDDSLLASLNAHVAQPSDDAADLEATSDATFADPDDYAVTPDEMADLRALDGDAAEAEGAIAAPDIAYDETYNDAPDVAVSNSINDDDAAYTLLPLETKVSESNPATDADPIVQDAGVDPMIAEIDSAYGPDVTAAPDLQSRGLRARARLIKVRRPDANEPAAQSASQDPAAAAPPADLPPVDLPREGRNRARMIKVRRAEAAAAAVPEVEDKVFPEPSFDDDMLAQPTPENAADADAPVVDVEAEAAELAAEAEAAVLAAEADAALRRELRALQQQNQLIEPSPSKTSQDDAPQGDLAAEDAAHPRLDPAGEEAVSRLLEQTNEAMAVPENRRRLSAIAHLKAAVAATVAERFAKGGSTPKEAETKRFDPYREDLARVVRPPHPPMGTDDAASSPRPAPLVLVSAQRIDRPRAAPVDGAPTLSSVPSGAQSNTGQSNAAVRPRRVSSAALAVDPASDADEDDLDGANIITDARGFAEFSERLGANSLAEILEAAAAYSVCIEGRPYFSRPQLMSQIGALSADSEYSREDGLRTFGALLRDGRIQKIKRGQFILTEGSRYLAEARALAG